MFSQNLNKLYLRTFVMLLLQYIVALSDVQYEGNRFVQEGNTFAITCIRSAYGVPKWTKDGSAVIPNTENNYTLSVEPYDDHLVIMKLKVESTTLGHRGEYKCDALSAKSHRIEVVPLTEPDEQVNRENVVLKVNDTLKLYCADVDNSIFPINWYKNGHRILESDDLRFSIEGRTLYLHQTTEEDAGDYLCAVEVSGLSYPAADHLGYLIRVTYAARVEQFPSQIRPILGRNLSLECGVHGYPAPRVSWLIDDIPTEMYEVNDSRYHVLDNFEGFPNSVFFIENVTYADVHVVTCNAENFQGFMKTSVLLAVRENMISTNEEYPGKGIVLTPGTELLLQCNTTDDPSLDVQWYQNGYPVNITDSRVHIENYNNTLMVQKATEADAGTYMCINTEEMVNATIVVRTKVKLVLFDYSRNVVQGQNVYLFCNVTQGWPQPVLQWLKDGEPLNLSDPRVTISTKEKGVLDSELTISEIDFDDRAEYMCMATNDVGSMNTTILIRVKDKYAALWPFLGICAEVAILCTIIFIYEKRRQKPDFDESDADHTTENKNVPDQEEKTQDIRQRK